MQKKMVLAAILVVFVMAGLPSFPVQFAHSTGLAGHFPGQEHRLFDRPDS